MQTNYLIKQFVRKMRIKYKNTDKRKLLIILLVITLFVISCPKSFARNFEYKGIFTAEQVFTTFCDSCFLELPAEYLQTNLILSVSSDKLKDFEQSIIKASRANGWELSRRGGTWKAEPIQNAGNLVFISCLTNDPVNVPAYLYYYAKKSDSLKCYLQNQEQIKRDSLYKLEQIKRDSLSKIHLPYMEYELKYYSFTKNFTDKLGFEWSEVLAVGDLPKRFELLDSWAFSATSANDTAFTHRRVNLALDSAFTLDWGTEEQTISNSLVSDGGVVNNNYEWRKYGLLVHITNTGEKTKLEYTFRDKENSISILQGSAVGALGDTIRIAGQYTANRQITRGVPLLSSVPILGILFTKEQNITDLKNFELYLIPNKKGEFKNEKDDSNN